MVELLSTVCGFDLMANGLTHFAEMSFSILYINLSFVKNCGG
jgi:hypothetical protein